MFGARGDDPLHVDGPPFVVAVPPDPGVDGSGVLEDLGFRILVQLRLVSPQAQQLGHKKDLARLRRHLHPHPGIDLELLRLIFSSVLLGRLDPLLFASSGPHLSQSCFIFSSAQTTMFRPLFFASYSIVSAIFR